jgi:hypothetical protein
MIYKKRNIMKKILLFIVFPLLMQSCLFEEENYFEEPASARIEEKITETKNVLSSQSNGWILHYFPRLSLGGHNYAISFSGEQAKIACESKVVGTSVNVGDPNYTDSCLYDIIPEQGAILTFNTYSIMHQFRNPSSAAYQGLGGDYEFILTSVKPDEIGLKGKTTGNTMRMFPIPGEYPDKASYLKAVQAMTNNGKVGSYLLYCDGKFIDTVMGVNRGRYLSYSYDEIQSNAETQKNDTVTTTANIPIIYTPDGFIVYHDKTENVKKDVYPVKKSELLLPVFDSLRNYTEFTYDQANLKFVSKDGKIEFVKIIMPINEQFAKTSTQWLFDCEDSEKSSAAFRSVYQTAYNANMNQWGETLSIIYIGLTHNSAIGSPTPYVFAFYSDGYWSTYGIKLTPVANTADQVNIETSGAGNTNGNWPYYLYFEPIVNFFIDNSPWQLIADDAESPTSIKLVSVNDNSLWAVVDM